MKSRLMSVQQSPAARLARFLELVLGACAVLAVAVSIAFLFAALSSVVRGGTKGPDFGTDPPTPGPTWEVTYRGMTQDVWNEIHAGAELIREKSGADLSGGVAVKRGGEWYTVQAPISTDGATDSRQECADETDELCRDAGHGGSSGAELTATQQGGCTCSADCDENGAVAFVISGNPCGG